MNEKDAVRKFCDCANCDDLSGCLESLKDISIETLHSSSRSITLYKKISFKINILRI